MVTARKTAATKTAAAPKGGALVKWDEALAARALKAKKTVANVGGGDWISCAGGKLSFQGNDVPGSKMDVVVLSSLCENAYYEGKFDPKNPMPPVCFAFGEDEDELAPHPKASNPQADSCAQCPNNEWGSGDGGTGKACKNIRRLALIPSDAMDKGEQGVKEAKIAFFKVPVTSVKGFASYVNECAAVDKPPLAFVTELSAGPDAKTQVKVSFNATEEITKGELIGALLAKADIADEQLVIPYEPASEAPAKPAARGRAAPAAKKAPVAAKKAAGKKY